KDNNFLFLPPRKRFKLLEKERRELEESQQAKHKERKELEEQRQKNCPKEKKELDEQRTKDCQTAYPLCSEITNVVRLSPNKIISKGFKVLEKRKHKELLQQQQQQKSKWKMGQEPAAQVKEKSLGLQKREEVVPSMKTTEQQQEEDEEEEDGVLCDVCRSTDAEPSDPIVFCDGCDVGVHTSCYGNPLRLSVPEGDWFCAQCLSHDPHSKTCCLCPSSDGAMKQTTDGSWAHISCAVFVPEVFFHSAEAREPINCSHVPSRRWKSVCSVCKSTGGACVECTETGCQSTFHISCGLKEDLAIDYRDSRSGAVVISFCKLHTPTWNQQQESKERVKFKIVSRDPKIGHKYKAQLHV
ncbi:unnamed protein product, partial [Sphagnum jensenii]